MVTVTPGSTPPVASLMVPRIPPRKSCAEAVGARRSSAVAQVASPLSNFMLDRKTQHGVLCQVVCINAIIRGYASRRRPDWVYHLAVSGPSRDAAPRGPRPGRLRGI